MCAGDLVDAVESERLERRKKDSNILKSAGVNLLVGAILLRRGHTVQLGMFDFSEKGIGAIEVKLVVSVGEWSCST